MRLPESDRLFELRQSLEGNQATVFQSRRSVAIAQLMEPRKVEFLEVAELTQGRQTFLRHVTFFQLQRFQVQSLGSVTRSGSWE